MSADEPGGGEAEQERIVRAIHRVPADPPRLRLSAYAHRVIPELAGPAHAKKACKRGELLLNGEPGDSARFVKEGDELRLLEPEKPRFSVHQRHLEVVYQDPWLAVVVKPAGLATSGSTWRTLAHALPYNLDHSEAADALASPWPVHRLDARTSGLVVVARTASARAALSQAFAERRVQKTYEALVVGRVEEAGESREPLDGRPSHTTWRPLASCHSLHVGHLTHLAVHPHTGRTHQIRRHLAERGHAVLGDDLYDPKPLRHQGLFLCAVALTIPHPDGSKEVRVAIPAPAKFGTTLAREEARWQRFHGRQSPTPEQPEDR